MCKMIFASVAWAKLNIWVNCGSSIGYDTILCDCFKYVEFHLLRHRGFTKSKWLNQFSLWWYHNFWTCPSKASTEASSIRPSVFCIFYTVSHNIEFNINEWHTHICTSQNHCIHSRILHPLPIKTTEKIQKASVTLCVNLCVNLCVKLCVSPCMLWAT